MRLVLTAAAFAMAAACSPSVAAPETETAEITVTAPAEETRVAAVLSFAEWCGSCKKLDPKVKAVRAANTFDGVEFFTLDYTKKDRDAYFADAATIGVEDTMRELFPKKVKTGAVILIDLASGDIISIVNSKMDEAEIKQAIEDAAALT